MGDLVPRRPVGVARDARPVAASAPRRERQRQERVWEGRADTGGWDTPAPQSTYRSRPSSYTGDRYYHATTDAGSAYYDDDSWLLTGMFYAARGAWRVLRGLAMLDMAIGRNVRQQLDARHQRPQLTRGGHRG